MLFDLQGKAPARRTGDLPRRWPCYGRRARAVRHRRRRRRRPAATRSSASDGGAADAREGVREPDRGRRGDARARTRATGRARRRWSAPLRPRRPDAGPDDRRRSQRATRAPRSCSKAEVAGSRYIATDPETIDPAWRATVIQVYGVGRLAEDQKDKNERTSAPRARSPRSRTPRTPTSGWSQWPPGRRHADGGPCRAQGHRRSRRRTTKPPPGADRARRRPAAAQPARRSGRRSGAAGRWPVTRLRARNATIPPRPTEEPGELPDQRRSNRRRDPRHRTRRRGRPLHRARVQGAPRPGDRGRQEAARRGPLQGHLHRLDDARRAGRRREAAAPVGGSLSLVCTDQNITKIFEITGLDRVFPIHKSRDEALANRAARPARRARPSSTVACRLGAAAAGAGQLSRAVSSIGRAGDS